VYVKAAHFTRLNETPTAPVEQRDLPTTVKMRPSKGGRGPVLACMRVYECMSGKELVNADMIVYVSGLVKLAVSL